MSKDDLKAQAIELRKKGRTYREILEVVPVAKSTLSEWLREVHLSKPQVQRITAKKELRKYEEALLRSGYVLKKQNRFILSLKSVSMHFQSVSFS